MLVNFVLMVINHQIEHHSFTSFKNTHVNPLQSLYVPFYFLMFHFFNQKQTTQVMCVGILSITSKKLQV